MSDQKKKCPGRARRKRGPSPKRRTGTTPAMTPLIDERALLRHGWYRRKLARDQAQGAQS